MTKFKVGDKVRVAVSEEFVPKGTILTVTKGPVGYARGGNYYFEGYPQTDNYCVLGGDLALAFEKPTKNQRITTLEQNVVSLESEVAELKAKVEALEALPKPTEVAEMFALAQLEAQSKANERSPKRVKPKSPNEQRKAIIAEAKAFVAENLVKNHRDAGGHGVWFSSKGGKIVTDKTEFIVDAKKRTVVAIVKGIRTGRVYVKGIAKCAPDDVFNADIGKAIALGRALGLDVSKFEQAVKPTEVVVGMKVTACFDGKTEEYTARNVYKEGGEVRVNPKEVMLGYYPYEPRVGDRIIDDTEAVY